MKIALKYRQLILGAGVIAILGLAAWDSVAASEQCFANWSEAAPIVVRENLVATGDIKKLVQAKLGAKIARITLCRAGARYEYRLVVFSPSGKPRKMRIDARKPVVP